MPKRIHPTEADPEPNYEAHMAQTIAELEAEVRRQNSPVPAVAGGMVGGIPDAAVRLNDPRPKGNLTGSYDPRIAQDVVQSAQRHKVDPALALAMSLQETTLGHTDPNNPMHENIVDFYNPGPEFGNAYSLLTSEDWNNDSPQHHFAREMLNRQGTLDAAMTHVAQLQKRHADTPEEHQIQAYNGLGKPVAAARSLGSLYGTTLKQLPQDFYGKRVQDIRDNFVNQSPYLQQLIKGLN